MTTFVQLHLLTAYPPANLNRDDTGRPKTAQFGGVTRLRQSSQALKRAFRTSTPFRDLLADHLGTRTKRLGEQLEERLKRHPDPRAAARRLADQLGKLKAEGTETEQLAHLTPGEVAALEQLADRLAAGEEIGDDAIKVLGTGRPAADIAMFGRMLAASPQFNVEAAVQVAHALSTHRVTVEDDYFTAVDDLKTSDDDRGAGHVGELGFGSGLFYLYVCVDKDLLVGNLSGDRALADTALEALVRAAATVGPRGKQNSFASRAYAGYVLAEAGGQQPRSLAAAFLKPVADPRGPGDEDHFAQSVRALDRMREQLDAAYGPNADRRAVMNVPAGTGTLQAIVDFVRAA